MKLSGLLSVMVTVMVTALSIPAMAAPDLKLFPVTQCPAIGEEYVALLAKLDTIKASVKDGANCANVSLKVKSLEELLVSERQKVLDIVEAGRTQSLTPEQSEEVRRYAENVTQKVAALYDLFSGSNRCFRDDDAGGGIAAMAGFVNEASRLVAGLSGPWGTPIALAGNVVAGFMTGLDKVMKSRAGYDFSKPENWKNYVQNLCTYYSYRGQIDHLLNPQARMNQLRSLGRRLDAQIELMNSRCEECQRIERNFEVYSADSEDVVRADQRFSKPFGTYMLYSVGIRRWVDKEMKRVERESASFWADISGRHILSKAREDLEQFLVTREAPRFLNFQIGMSRHDYGAFQGFALQEGRALYLQLTNENSAVVTAPVRYYFADPAEMFKALVVKPLQWELVPREQMNDLRYSWTFYRDRGIDRLRTAQASLQVVQGFCSFFMQAGYYSSAIKNACTGHSVRDLAGQIAVLDRDLASADLGTGLNIDLGVFEPRVGTNPRGPRSPLDSLSLFVDQLKPD